MPRGCWGVDVSFAVKAKEILRDASTFKLGYGVLLGNRIVWNDLYVFFCIRLFKKKVYGYTFHCSSPGNYYHNSILNQSGKENR